MQDLSQLREIDAEVFHLERAAALLSWDQETYMPKMGIEGRSEQIAALETLVHQKATSDEVGRLLEAAGASESASPGSFELSSFEGAFLRAWSRRYYRQKKIPHKLVGRLAKEASKAQAIWSAAKEANEFPMFAPSLELVVELVREMVEHIGYTDNPYDALLEGYEPESSSAEIAGIFSALADRLSPIVRAIGEAEKPDVSFLGRSFSIGDQEKFGRSVIAEIGFPADAGRLDVSSHPFATSIGTRDVRLTTRYSTDHFQTSLFGSMHEAGHGLYELGFDDTIAGTILANGTSLGIHESQSRSWENLIGRSRAFWIRYLPRLSDVFPSQLQGVSVDQFYSAINTVESSHIRVEADEVTYSLHIILRFNLEMRIIAGELAIGDLPDAWRAESARLLGIEPPSDSLGVLQDIHWSMGAFGYFPTYALGNLYGAQFDAAMRSDLKDVDRLIEAGEFGALLTWQREHIHKHGSAKTAREICQSVSGEGLNPAYFADYVERKYSALYAL